MNCVIIEDELPAQKLVERYISKLPELKLIASFQSALEANGFLQRSNVDLIFLDINLPDITGIQYIRTLSSPPKVIMTTAYPEYAVESFELETICDYLVKPFSFDRFLKAINKAKKNNPHPKRVSENLEEEAHIYVNIDKTLHKVFLNDVLYLESDRNYITLVSTKGKYTFIDALKIWVDKLPAEDFIQVHKSFIINHRKIEKIKGNRLHFQGISIPIGRTYKEQLRKRLELD